MERMILNDFKKRLTNLGLAWIDYMKSYDIVLPSLYFKKPDIRHLEHINDNTSNSIMRTKKWNMELTSCGKESFYDD